MTKTLKSILKSNPDADVCMCMVAELIGLLPDELPPHVDKNDSFYWFREYKSHWCSRTKVHDAIWVFLESLEELGAIIWDGSRFVWNDEYKLTNDD